MHTRFVSSIIGGIAGGFLVAASLAFAAGTTAWLAFGIGLGLMVLSVVPALSGNRMRSGLLFDGVAGLLAAWTVIASVVFTDGVVRWLSFGEGVAFAALALGALTLDHIHLTRRVNVAAPIRMGYAVTEDTENSRHEAVAA